MSTFLEDLDKYFRETPREQIMSEWAEFEKYDSVGPSVDEFIKTSKRFTMECPDVSQIDINNINNPKFNLRVSSFI